MSIAPAFLTLTGLAGDEREAVDVMSRLLGRYAGPNTEANAYYEARKVLSSPGFTIPQEVASRLAPVVGAPGIVVDVLDERLDFLGWDDALDLSDSDELGLRDVYDRNELDCEAPTAHLDALVYGTSFVRVGSGDGGPLVTMHSPNATTGLRDPQTRRLRVAWTALESSEKGERRGVIDWPDQSVTVREVGGRWVVDDRDVHNLGRVPVVQLVNRPRSSRGGGRSEITPAIRSLTEDAMRAGLGMNTNTMFYSIPQLMVLGRGPDAFQDRDGNPAPGWKILTGHALTIDKDEDGDQPSVQQLTVASPAPFINQLREFRMQVASEAGMPADYLGIQTSNPSSADAIRAGEIRLVKRAERRQSGFGRAWQEVARLALLVRDGFIPDDFESRVAPYWRPASTPTAAATADEMTKYVASGALRPDSAIIRKRMSLSRSEERILASEQRRIAGGSVLESMSAVPQVSQADEMRAKFEALGVAIRAGVDPQSAAVQLGLSGLEFTAGAVPAEVVP